MALVASVLCGLRHAGMNNFLFNVYFFNNHVFEFFPTVEIFRP